MLATDDTIRVDLSEDDQLYLSHSVTGPRSIPSDEICKAAAAPPPASGGDREMSGVDNHRIGTSEAAGEDVDGESDDVVVKLEEKSLVMNSKALAQRIISATLRREHLQYLIAKEDKKYAAACAVHRLQQPHRFSWAYETVSHLLILSQSVVKSLAEAVPVTPFPAPQGSLASSLRDAVLLFACP